MYITEERFEKMIEELLCDGEPCYAELDAIVRDCSRNHVIGWGTEYSWFNVSDVEDILQRTVFAVKLKVIDSFLRVNGVDTVNRNIGGFVAWVRQFAHNITRDHIRKEGKHHFKRTENDDMLEAHLGEDVYKAQFNAFERVEEAVSRVLAAKRDLHVTFAWLLQMIYMLDHNCDHKDVLRDVAEYHSRDTVTQVYEFILCASDRIACLRITSEQDACFQKALLAVQEDGRRYGDKRLEELFMKNSSGAESFSKWWSRVNNSLREQEGKKVQKGKKQDEASENG